MFRKGQISTETDKGPFIFTLIALVAGTVVTVLLFVFGKGEPLAIFAGVMFAAVTLAAGGVMLALVTDKVYIENDVLYMSYLFKKRSIAVSEIGRISFSSDIYYVFDKKGTAAGTFNAKLTRVGEIIAFLDMRNVNFA